MSGDPPAGGRTCLKPGEVDPLGQAQLCQDGKDIDVPTTSQVTQTPSVSHLPQVGAGDWGLTGALWFAAIAVCIYAVVRSRGRWK